MEDLACEHLPVCARRAGDHPHTPVAELEEAALEAAHAGDRRDHRDPRRVPARGEFVDRLVIAGVGDPDVGRGDVAVGEGVDAPEQVLARAAERHRPEQ